MALSLATVVRQTNIAQKKFRVIIADESHTIKSWKAKRTSHLQPLLKDARRCILLTGVTKLLPFALSSVRTAQTLIILQTPALSRPEELFTQLHALDPQIFVVLFRFVLVPLVC